MHFSSIHFIIIIIAKLIRGDYSKIIQGYRQLDRFLSEKSLIFVLHAFTE